MGRAGGDPFPGDSPFVAALATLRGWGQMIAPTLKGIPGREGVQNPQSQPSIRRAVQPAHAHPFPTSQFVVCQPAFPVSKNTNEKTRSSLAGLVCLSVCLTASLTASLSGRLFSFVLSAISYLAYCMHLHLSRLLLHFARTQTRPHDSSRPTV